MTKGLWVVWNYKNKDADYGDFDELYLSVFWLKPKYRPTTKQIKDYVKLCKDKGYKVYLCVNCYADENKNRTFEEIIIDIDYFAPLADGLSLDYIRYNNMRLANYKNDTPIMNVLEYAKTKCNDIKMAVFPIHNSWLYGQRYNRMQKFGVIQPMLYPYSMFGSNYKLNKTLTNLLIRLTKILYPKSEPCLQAWADKKSKRTMKDLNDDISACGNDGYSIFRYKTYLKL